MATVRSGDGTTIGYERSGAGPALILVDGAMCYRGGGPMRPLAARLASDFTVYAYDRRGRGESTDTPPYTVDSEVADLRALIGEAGGSAHVCGISSGGALALAAAAAGIGITLLAVYEVPYVADWHPAMATGEYRRGLDAALAQGRRGDAVALFMANVGVPPQAIEGMRGGPGWPAMEAIAPTLAYDDTILGDARVPVGTAGRVTVPTLVLDGGASPQMLRDAAKSLAAALPDARHETLDGQTHDVAPEALAPALTAFFLG
jgi:pimeloyl-ACP methyl ester carboxylesterase